MKQSGKPNLRKLLWFNAHAEGFPGFGGVCAVGLGVSAGFL